jgi:ABC-type transporter Mla maintaining outer membrane lipid asymmetry ATPase subunit MlaF
MMMKIRAFIVAAGILAATSAVAVAQEQGGVSIGKDVDIKVKTGDVTTSATGEGAVAETNIGAVTGRNTKVGGNVKIDATTGNVTTTANGKQAKACSNIGMVGTSACQQ